MKLPQPDPSMLQRAVTPAQSNPMPRHFSTHRWLSSLVALMLVSCSGVWLYAQQSVNAGRFESVNATPAYVVVGTSTPIVFTTVISDSSLRKHDPLRVVLVRTDASGTPVDITGRMRDNGKKSDIKRNDHTYTLQVTLNESAVGPVYFRVAALFKSSLLPRGKDDDDDDWDKDLAALNDPKSKGPRRSRLPPLVRKLQKYELSQQVAVSVWTSVSEPSAGFQLMLPPGWTSTRHSGGSRAFYPPGKSSDPASEYNGSFVLFVDQNPAGLTLEEFYSGLRGPNLFGDAAAVVPVSLGGLSGFRFVTTTGFVGGDVIVVRVSGAFIRIEDRGDVDTFEQIVRTLSSP